MSVIPDNTLYADIKVKTDLHISISVRIFKTYYTGNIESYWFRN